MRSLVATIPFILTRESTQDYRQHSSQHPPPPHNFVLHKRVTVVMVLMVAAAVVLGLTARVIISIQSVYNKREQ